MLSVGKAIDAAVWAVLVCCNWLVHQCQAAVEWWLDAVLGTWEESLKAVIRESFAQATRLVNGIFAWLLAVFAESHQSWHHPFKRSQAWQAWWRENRPSTFNAIIARDRTSSRLPSPYMSSYSTLRSTFSKGGWSQFHLLAPEHSKKDSSALSASLSSSKPPPVSLCLLSIFTNLTPKPDKGCQGQLLLTAVMDVCLHR